MAIQLKTVEIYCCDVCKETFGNIHYAFNANPYLKGQIANHTHCYRCKVEHPNSCSRRSNHICFDTWCSMLGNMFADINEAIEKGITNIEVWEKWRSECHCD